MTPTMGETGFLNQIGLYKGPSTKLHVSRNNSKLYTKYDLIFQTFI